MCTGPRYCYVGFLSVALSFHSTAQVQPFAYNTYGEVLATFVDDTGMVDYRGLKARPAALEGFLAQVAALDAERYEAWPEREQIAFWLNTYNALTLKLIVDHYPIHASSVRSLVFPSNSIRQIPGAWNRVKWRVMGRDLTLDEIEHGILRRRFKEPRIHAALVCAAVGCPPLRNEPYTCAALDEQLAHQMRRFLENPAKFRVDAAQNRVYLSPIFDWFAGDFAGQRAGNIGSDEGERRRYAVLAFIREYVDEEARAALAADSVSVRYLDYDWRLNERKTPASDEAP